MKSKQLALNVDGVRAGLFGGMPMDADYMAGVKSRAAMLSKACRLKPTQPSKPTDQYVIAVKKIG